MSLRKKLAPVLAVTLTLGLFAASAVNADEHDQRARFRTGSIAAAKVPQNALYKQECSSCHFLYQPWLLPERSWKALVDGQDKHFGENLGLDDSAKKELFSYLATYSSEKISLRWAKKITVSSEGVTPQRIMDVPWIRKEHREVEHAFKRPSIGSASNCGACHTKGAEGNFDEDWVKIPKE